MNQKKNIHGQCHGIPPNKRYLIVAGFFLLCSFTQLSHAGTKTMNRVGEIYHEKQPKMIKGKVVNEKGAPLAGALVTVYGSTRGVSTDVDGTFEIAVNRDDQIRVSLLGYEERMLPILDNLDLFITLKEKIGELDEVVVVAFGVQKKESIVGAISTLKPDNIKQLTGKISNSLAGQMAGIVAVQRSGEPGAGADFWIRGISSFGANNRPLVLVDGIERQLDLVDAEDIESFSILKDATATAVYGVRGANGIVLITTKRGKEGRFVINARSETGFMRPLKMIDMADAGQWIDYYNDISVDRNGRKAFEDDVRSKYINGTDPDLYPNIDWMNEIFKKQTTSHRTNINVTGGSKRIRYYVGGSYFTENGIYNSVANTEYSPAPKFSKFSFRSNIDMDVSSSTTVSLNLSNQFETKNGPGANDLWTRSMMTTPIATPTIYSDGTIASPPLSSNPWNVLNQTGYTSSNWNNAQSLLGLTQDFSNIITKGLKFNAKVSWDILNESWLARTKNPSTFYAIGRDDEGNLIFKPNSQGSDFLGLNGRGNDGSYAFNLESSFTYDRTFSEKHAVGALFLFNMRERTENFPNKYIDAFKYKNQGIASRLTYAYNNTYFIEGNFGYNGSENFAPTKRFGFFPSLALGYMISNESYFEPLKKIVSIFKIRGSHGKIGNDKIGGNRRFAYNSELIYSGGYNFGSMRDHWIGGIATGQFGDLAMSWETAIKTDIGVELELFKKIKIQADYFRDKREGIYIVQQSVPSIVGMNVEQYVNLGRMLNSGFDGSLEYSHKVNDFIFQFRGNFTFNRNKKLYDDRPTPLWSYREEAGFVNEQQKGLVALGLYTSDEDIQNSPRVDFGTVRPGDIKYRDINGDGIINDNDEVAIGYSTIPEINYGFGTSITWKSFDIGAFFQGTDHATRFIGGSPIFGSGGNILYLGQIYADVADNRWSLNNPNPNAPYPRMTMGENVNNQRNSTFYQRDMSFIRLKNAEIGYTLPTHIAKAAKVAKARFFVQGINLITWSTFKLWDPELSTYSGDVYPQMKTFTAGLNLTL